MGRSIERIIQLPEHSFFLFGARGVGKSTLIKEKYLDLKKSQVLYLDLLEAETEEKYQKNPDLLFERLQVDFKKISTVIIDEVQKIPKLLDVVHKCSERYKSIIFIMTGSSARKLKRGQANLLAGRAFAMNMHPLTHLELKNTQLLDLLTWGGLPKVWNLKNPIDRVRFLKTYSQVYLKEEIQIEQLVRNISSFRQFLDFVAQSNGEIINYSNIAKKSGIEESTVSRFFEILVDTLIGFFLEPYDESIRKRQMQKPKFYLFDLGVYRSLTQEIKNEVIIGSSEYGRLFEHFIICECFRLNDYFETDYRFFYIRTKDNAEIDLIVKKSQKEKILIEIKSSNQVTFEDCKHLISLGEDIKNSQKWIICNERHVRQNENGILILPWKEALNRLFNPK